jgi:hypothetical protein
MRTRFGTSTKCSNFEKHAKRKIRGLFFNKKAASVVVSTIILTAMVVAASIAVLYWTQSMSKIGNTEYSKNTKASSNAVEERLGFEYVTYAGRSLTVNIVNWGETSNVTIAHVLVLDSSYNYVGSNLTAIRLTDIDNKLPISGNSLSSGSDGYFTTIISNPGSLQMNHLYYVRIVTSSGRNFDGSFVAT